MLFHPFPVAGTIVLMLKCFSYLRPAPEGIMVDCEVDVVHSGKSLALLRGAMRTKDGKLISTCEHDKAAIPNKAGFDRASRL